MDTVRSKTFLTGGFAQRKTVFERVSGLVGFESVRQRWGFALAIALPLVVFAAVTGYEGCLLRESVKSQALLEGRACQVLGMSFSGDPMVWGFIIFVPIQICIVSFAWKRTKGLLGSAAEKASAAWKADSSLLGFNAAVERVNSIWQMRGGW